MKQIIPLLLVGTLVLTSLGAVALSGTDVESSISSVALSSVEISDIGEYVSVDIAESTSMRMNTGEPVLPVVTKVMTFPLGTTITNIDVSYETEEVALLKAIEPAPAPQIVGSAEVAEVEADMSVYGSSELYPSEAVNINYGAGLDSEGNHVMYVTVSVTPQYAPLDNTLTVPSSAIVYDIDYVLPDEAFITADEYDMVVITSAAFEDATTDFVTHKNDIGVRTYVKTVEDIYEEYDGRIDPESIKLFIKDAVETQGIQYVLLAGGRQGQTFKWHVPEFRSNNAADTESGYSSDLYYGDIYKIVENVTLFEDWDPNGDGIIGEWTNKVGHKDTPIDYYPDVHVSRIAAHYKFELKNALAKIITYENTADDSWFKKAIMIAGDTFPDTDSYYEGEIETNQAVNMLEPLGFEITKLWTSLDTLTGEDDVISAFSEGAGIVYFAGHGNPAVWSTHPPHGGEDGETWTDGMQMDDFHKFKNGDKLPIVYVDGCHNAQFNCTMAVLLEDIKEYGIAGTFFSSPFAAFYFEWVPRDFCSYFVLQKSGGGIASIGCAGFGYGYVGQHTTEGLGGWIGPRFFDAYANQSIDVLGEMKDQAITDYINIIGGVNDDQIDRKTIEQWTLEGDPSMKVGGL